jgi:plasmid stabilization system protein ParE
VSRRVRTADSASAELEAAIRWYEIQRPALGAEFYAAVLESVQQITTLPESGATAFDDPDVRRVLVKRFPYQVVYRVRPNELQILAFAHLKRRPGFWKGRS